MARYKNTEECISSSEDPALTPVQSKMARVGLGLGIRDVAKLAGVSTNTLHRFESGEQLRPETLNAIRIAYEQTGARFFTSPKGERGVVICED